LARLWATAFQQTMERCCGRLAQPDLGGIRRPAAHRRAAGGGGSKQHGPHLPVGVDSFIAQAYLARVRALLPAGYAGAHFAVQAVGASDEHKAFPGTLTLAPKLRCTPSSRSRERCPRRDQEAHHHQQSWWQSRHRRSAARQLRVRHGMLAVHCSWGRFGYPDGLFSPSEHTHGIHAATSRHRSCSPRIRNWCGAKKSRISGGNLRDGARLYLAARGFSGRLRLDDAGSARLGRGRRCVARERRKGEGRARSWRAGVYRIAQGCGKVRSGRSAGLSRSA